MELKLKIPGVEGGDAKVVHINPSDTAETLKKLIKDKFGISVKKMIYQGRILEEAKTIEEQKIGEGHAIHVMAYPPGTEPPPPAAEKAAPPSAPAPPPPIIRALENVPQADKAVLLETLLKIIDNITKNPMEPKYRQIKKANKGFSTKVGSIQGGADCMLALGFTDSPTHYVLHAAAPAWQLLLSSREACAAAEKALSSPSAPVEPHVALMQALLATPEVAQQMAQAQGSGGEGEGKTEEELIAEAIAMSIEEEA